MLCRRFWVYLWHQSHEKGRKSNITAHNNTITNSNQKRGELHGVPSSQRAVTSKGNSWSDSRIKKKIRSRTSWWGHTFSDATWNNPVQKLMQNPFNADVNSLPRPIKLQCDSRARDSFESTSIENSWTKYFSIDPKAFHHFLFLVLIYARLCSKLSLYQKCKSTSDLRGAHWTFKRNFCVCRKKRYRPSN